MPTMRYATAGDAPLITKHRHWMFRENAFGTEAALSGVDAAFEPWVRDRLEDGRYIGLLLEEEGRVVAGAGIFFADFPPHWMDPMALRAYVLNVYTEADARGKGYAKVLMRAVLAECRERGVLTVVLHASPQGRPVYEGLGFRSTDEMMLRLEVDSGAFASGIG